ncbi:MAG: PD-(D/E)XK nuclease family protein [Dialister sp.]|nr:PD-(D/E)XK nuclease family protein [Dialister sp.]
MGLHFIFGRPGSGKTRRCCEEIRDYLRGNSSRRAILIVPDQGTYTAEYMLASIFPGKGFMNTDVLGFSRLAYRICNELHSPLGDTLTPLGQQLVLLRLLSAHKKQFKTIGRAAGMPHFSEMLANFFHQLDLFCISPSALSSAAEAEEDTPLGQKLSDLALLYQAYHDYLSTHFSYAGSLLDLLAREIHKSQTIQNTRIWIDGFNGMPPQKMNVVSALIGSAPEVTVTVPMDSPDSARENPYFARPYHMYEMVATAAGHFDAVTLRTSFRFQNEETASVAKHFFSIGTPAAPKKAGPAGDITKGIHIIDAPNRDAEIDYIAGAIIRLVRDHGLRYKDILILLRNPDAYTDSIRRAFRPSNIPVFIDEKRHMTSHPLVLLITSLLSFLQAEKTRSGSGYQRKTILSLLKTGLLPNFSDADVDRLENYLRKYGIRSWQWDSEWKFRDSRGPDQDAGPVTEKEAALSQEANRWRMSLLSLLSPLAKDWVHASVAHDRCRLLYDWLMKQGIPDKLSALDAEEFKESKTKPHLQVWKKVLSLMDEIVHVSRKDPMEESEFSSILQDGLSSLTFSMIPPTLDHVTVTSAERGYSMEADAVFIPGALEGEFPQHIDEGGFFTEKEMRHLEKEEHLSFGSDLLTALEREQFYTQLALTRMRSMLCFTCPASVSGGKNAEMSFLLSRLESLGYVSSHRQAPLPSLTSDAPSFFMNPVKAISLLSPILSEGVPADDSNWTHLKDWILTSGSAYAPLLQEMKRGLSYDNTAHPLSKELARRLFKPGGRLYGSVTSLEAYRSCPYQYFLKHGLSLRERDAGELAPPDFGNYMHAGLHRFGNEILKRNKQWRDATDEDISALSEEIASTIAPRIKSGALDKDAASRYTKRALKKSFRRSLEQLRDWSRSSRFDTKGLEKKFLLKLQSDEAESFTLEGTIDRIDQNGNRVAIYDYKTGTPHLSLDDILSGYKLQLITYLLAVMEANPESPLLPAAIMYIYLSEQDTPLPLPPDPENEKAGAGPITEGYMVDDTAVLQSLEQCPANKKRSTFIPVSYTKEGVPSQNNQRLLSEAEFSFLLSQARQKLIQLYRQIDSGLIPITPIRIHDTSPCSYCRYRSICRFDPDMPGESYDYVPHRSNTVIKKEWKGQLTPKKEDNHE